jgi:non-specific protein-tyrosine kinase
VDEARSELEFREYLRVLNRRKWIIILTILAAVGSAVAISTLSDKVYSTDAQVLVADPTEGSVFNVNVLTGLLSGRDLQTQIQILGSKPLHDQVRRQLGSRASFIGHTTVSQIGATSVIRVRVESTIPSVARDAANALARTYIDRRTHEAVATLIEAGDTLRKSIDEKKSEIADLDAQLARASAPPKSDTAQVESLQAQRDNAQRLLSTFEDKYDQLQVDASLRSGGAQLVSAAALPSIPVRPRPIRNAALAIALGLFVGVGLAFLFEFLDDTVKSPDDIERHAPNLAFLGAIPAVADWRNRDRARAITLEAPHSPISEAYRSLRTSVQFVALRQPLQTLLLTSPMSSEGKSTTIANLGVTLARSGRDVVLVDCDLRRPRLHQFFGVDNGTGFTSVLLGEEPITTALRRIDIGTSGSLRLLPSGALPPNPSELLGTNRVAELLTALQAAAEIVLIDSPPLLPVTDALVLSRRVDGVLLVATAGLTSRRHLARSVALLSHAEAPIIGVTLNAVSAEAGYGDHYGYYYREDASPKRRRRKKVEARAKQ